MTTAQWYVGIIGAGEADERTYAIARETGYLAAVHGAVVVCGGLGGVMEAACAGCASAGGVSLAVLPGSDRHDANAHASYQIATGMGQARNVIIAVTADVLIAIGGSSGTLSEIGHALKLGKPVISLGSWRVTAPDTDLSPIIRVASAQQAVTQAREAIQGQER